jgi:inhibitor of cysteine peptidase
MRTLVLIFLTLLVFGCGGGSSTPSTQKDNPNTFANNTGGTNNTFTNNTGGFTNTTTIPDTTANQYSISGTITLSGQGLDGVTVLLSPTSFPIMSLTDTTGHYSLSNLANGYYTVAPSKNGYVFAPENRTETVYNSNISDQDFLAMPYSGGFYIAGRVTHNGTGFSGVKITMFSDASAGMSDLYTDSKGWFYVRNVSNDGRTYYFRPSKTGYSFTPDQRSVKVTDTNVAWQDFIASNL